MDPWHAIVYGIVQGLTEFLPISSSGHLALVEWITGWDDFEGNPELDQAFSVAVHLGTLLAVLAYFRRDLVKLVGAGIGDVVSRRQPFSDDGRLAWLLIASAVPAAIAGALFNDAIEDLDDVTWMIGAMLIVAGLVLGWADSFGGQRSASQWTWRHALIMGGAQALALQPGVSRSGATMTAGLFLKYQRTEVARIAFLMSIPVIAGAGLYEGAQVLNEGGVPADYRSAFALGFISSAVTGWFAIWATLRIVRTRSFRPFVIYRVVLGSAVLVGVAAGV
jgi:undecaprenyl-diphosphatase